MITLSSPALGVVGGGVANLLVYFSIKLSREREREVTQKIDGKFL